MAFPVIPLVLGGAALAWIAFRRKPSEGDALDAAARDAAARAAADEAAARAAADEAAARAAAEQPLPVETVPTPPGSTHTVTLPANIPPWAPKPSETAKQAGASTGQSVRTATTVTEPAGALVPIVEPQTQPKMQPADKQATARTLAPQLDAALKANIHGYRYASNPMVPRGGEPAMNWALFNLVKSFQTNTGIKPDGFYGPVTSGALMHYLGVPPPGPFFYAADRVIKIFRPTPVA
jgi:Flp pilus assembly protein TadG